MIIYVPNKVLTQTAKVVNKIDKEILSVVDRMKKELMGARNPKGVGLAAPQIGIGYRIFITKPTVNDLVRVFINPEIIWKSEELAEIQRPGDDKKSGKEKKLEGCLSIPNVWGYLRRHKSIRLKYMTIEGIISEEEFSGFMATIIQHETDHINGILFSQRVLQQKEKLYRVEEDRKGNEKLVEIEI
jgi:peptide deformylase